MSFNPLHLAILPTGSIQLIQQRVSFCRTARAAPEVSSGREKHSFFPGGAGLTWALGNPHTGRRAFLGHC